MNPKQLTRFFERRRDGSKPLALATVVETRGSTYSKAGALMLIDEHGIFQGMLSGGCLEGDLAIRAQQVIESGKAQDVTYDLAADNEELWGLGVGCDGMMKVSLRPLYANDDYSGFATVLQELHDAAPALLVLGGGLDAEPLVQFADQLGWRATVVDHRPGYLERGDFGAASAVVCAPVADLEQHVELAAIDAAIVMSHHLASDREYLRQLAASDVGYIGLLGPAARREKLLAEIGEPAASLAGRLHGPAGLDIGGRGPAAIALSIVAQVQQYLGVGRQADSGAFALPGK